MKTNPSSDKGENGGFCILLREVLTGLQLIDTLLGDPEFKRRLLAICRGLTRDIADADELFDDVCVKVWKKFKISFKPDYTHDYGNFFAWLRQVARRTFLDEKRRPKIQLGDERVEDLSVKDQRINIEEQFLHSERVEELERCINAMPERERLAVTHYLGGLTSRENAELLIKAGFLCTHVTALKWVRDGFKRFFPNAEGLPIEDPERKAAKLARAGADKEISSKKKKA